jgi:hypothetical protein
MLARRGRPPPSCEQTIIAWKCREREIAHGCPLVSDDSSSHVASIGVRRGAASSEVGRAPPVS